MKDLNSPVPFNLSKILVELGYKDICFNYYKIDNKARIPKDQYPRYVLHHNSKGVHNYDNLKLYMLAPSYQEAWNWLNVRAQNFNIHFWVEMDLFGGYHAYYTKGGIVKDLGTFKDKFMVVSYVLDLILNLCYKEYLIA